MTLAKLNAMSAEAQKAWELAELRAMAERDRQNGGEYAKTIQGWIEAAERQ